MSSKRPFFLVCNTSNASSIVPYVCSLSSMCSAYFEFCLFALMAYRYMLVVSGLECSSCLSDIF
jgi:hypothetical protein